MMKKLLAKKKNNKGFSLVELIVVVLIIAIIAVALAPQVMKWVATSRTNVDENNAANIKSAVQTGIADAQAHGETITAVTEDAADFATAGTYGYYAYIKEVLGDDIPTKQAGGQFQVIIASSGDSVSVEVN